DSTGCLPSSSNSLTLRAPRRHRAESHHGADAKHDDDRHDDERRDDKWCPGLRRGQPVSTAQTTWLQRQDPARGTPSSARLVTVSATSEMMPTPWDGHRRSTGKKNPVTLVETPVARTRAVQPGSLLPGASSNETQDDVHRGT